MHLASYLESEGVTDAEFARRISVNQSTVLRLKRGERKPSIELVKRIFDATAGKVAADTWFAAPPKPTKRRKAA